MVENSSSARRGWGESLAAGTGALILLVGMSPLIRPAQPSWVVWLLLWSPGVLMLLGERLAWVGKPVAVLKPWHYGMILVCLWVAMLWPPGAGGVALVSLWLLLRTGVAAGVLYRWRHLAPRTAGEMCLDAARLFPVIGAAWLLANRLNWMPFGFDALVVLLTAAHFHHAGFTLPLMAGLCAKHGQGWLPRLSCTLVLAGVPLVAAGITGTHFGRVPWLEPLSVAVLVLGALGVAFQQLQQAFQKDVSGMARCLFLISGLSLSAAMLLALGYGLRSLLPATALTLPQMWAVHGGMNVFGFGLCGILAWRFKLSGKRG